jgi:hypothetical protein
MTPDYEEKFILKIIGTKPKLKDFMNKFLVLSIALFSIHSMPLMANSPVFYAKVFQGNSNITKIAPTECTYSTQISSKEGVGKTIRIFLNTDENSSINYMVEIPEADLPLKEGYQIAPYKQMLITYKRGILHLEEVQNDQMGPMGKVTDTMDIQVSANLLSPMGGAHATSVYRSLIHPLGQMDKELHCQF